jgi:hypothetical protein
LEPEVQPKEDEASGTTGRLKLLGQRLHFPEDRIKRTVVVAVVVLMVLGAVIGVALMGGDEGHASPRYVDVTSLEPFNATGSEGIFLEVGQEGGPISLAIFFYLLELPQEAGQVSVCFIDHISVRVSWTDEPDENGFLWDYENQPDTVRLTMTDREGWFDFSEEATNAHGEEAEILFEWDGDGVFFAEALDYDGEYTYSGVDGWEYIRVDNNSVSWDNHVEDGILLVEAGDQVHQRLPLTQVDDGNVITYEVSISGYYQRFGP